MTRQTLETIRKFLVTARVSRPEEDEFFRALNELDRLLTTATRQRETVNS
jgi:hypothetical protein